MYPNVSHFQLFLFSITNYLTFPLSVFIVTHYCGIVNTFLKKFCRDFSLSVACHLYFRLEWHSAKFTCFVVGIIPYDFSLRTLVHIYIPHTYTPCGRVIGNLVLLRQLASWGLPLPSLALQYYINILLRVCQHLF